MSYDVTVGEPRRKAAVVWANTVTIVWSEEVESQSGYGETSINASESKRQKVKTIK